MRYIVKTFREAGLEAKWTRTRRGAPIIAVRNPNAELAHQREQWWVVSGDTWRRMQEDGILEAFDSATYLGDVFSVPA